MHHSFSRYGVWKDSFCHLISSGACEILSKSWQRFEETVVTLSTAKFLRAQECNLFLGKYMTLNIAILKDK